MTWTIKEVIHVCMPGPVVFGDLRCRVCGKIVQDTSSDPKTASPSKLTECPCGIHPSRCDYHGDGKR